MKKWIILICAALCVSFAACGESGRSVNGGLGGEIAKLSSELGELSSQLEEKTQTFYDGETSIFHSLEIEGGTVITADFDVYLSQTEARFLFIDVTEDTEAALHYTYSTRGKAGVRMGYYPDGSDSKTSVELQAKPDGAFRQDWTDEKMTLKKGTNIFYMAGEGLECKLYLEVKAENPDCIEYAGLTPREED